MNALEHSRLYQVEDITVLIQGYNIKNMNNFKHSNLYGKYISHYVIVFNHGNFIANTAYL